MLYHNSNKREISSRMKRRYIMEHFDLVEKLVNTFGVSYEEAKNALEATGWDPVEAAVILEHNKQAAPTQDAASKIKNAARENFESASNTVKDEGTKFFKTIWDFLSLNEVVVKKPVGDIFLNLPLWLAVLLICAFFWPVVFILAIVFLMGYRFTFTGPQLGKKNVKNAAQQAQNFGEDIVEKVKNSVINDVPADSTPAESAAEPEIIVDSSTQEVSNDQGSSEQNE